MIKGIFINRDELDALIGLSVQARSLYLFLREHMDMKTRIVGGKYRISEKACQEALEEHRPKGLGHQIIKHTIEQVRTAIDALQRVGLIGRTGRPMVFLLALAKGESVRQKQTPHEQPTVETATNPANTRDSSHTPHGTPSQTADTSGVRVSVSKSIASSDPIASALSPKAAAAFSWIQEAGNGTRIAKPTGAQAQALETLFGAGKSAVTVATHAAKDVRSREQSPAPINVGLVKSCLPKGAQPPAPGAQPPAPTRINTNTTGTTTAPAKRPATTLPTIDSDSVSEGQTFFANIARKRAARAMEAAACSN